MPKVDQEQVKELTAQLEKCPLCTVRSKTLLKWVAHIMNAHNIEGPFPFKIELR